MTATIACIAPSRFELLTKLVDRSSERIQILRNPSAVEYHQLVTAIEEIINQLNVDIAANC
jgi:hypothetical protein